MSKSVGAEKYDDDDANRRQQQRMAKAATTSKICKSVLDQFQLLEDEFMKRYGEARFNMLSDDNDDESTTLYDALDALDDPSNVVTEMVSDKKTRCNTKEYTEAWKELA
jgi:hypothetical protein